MIVHLNYNNKLYSLNLLNVDIWTHEASITENDLTDFIFSILSNNSNLEKNIDDKLTKNKR